MFRQILEENGETANLYKKVPPVLVPHIFKDGFPPSKKDEDWRSDLWPLGPFCWGFQVYFAAVLFQKFILDQVSFCICIAIANSGSIE